MVDKDSIVRASRLVGEEDSVADHDRPVSEISRATCWVGVWHEAHSCPSWKGFVISRRSCVVPKPPRVLGGTIIVVFEARGRGCCRRFSRTAPDLLLRGQGSGANPLCYPNVRSDGDRRASWGIRPHVAATDQKAPPLHGRPFHIGPSERWTPSAQKSQSADVGIFHAIGAGWWLEPTCLVR